MTNDSIKEEMIRHIQGHNKMLTPEYLQNLSKIQLLAECHPAYRADYAKLCGIYLTSI